MKPIAAINLPQARVRTLANDFDKSEKKPKPKDIYKNQFA